MARCPVEFHFVSPLLLLFLKMYLFIWEVELQREREIQRVCDPPWFTSWMATRGHKLGAGVTDLHPTAGWLGLLVFSSSEGHRDMHRLWGIGLCPSEGAIFTNVTWNSSQEICLFYSIYLFIHSFIYVRNYRPINTLELWIIFQCPLFIFQIFLIKLFHFWPLGSFFN